MRVSINATDDVIVIDGAAGKVDCNDLWKQGIAAVQWHADYGEIEYIGHVKPSEAIDDFSPFQHYVDDVEFPPEPPPPQEPPELPPDPPAPVGLKMGLAPVEEILLDHENRLRAMEKKPPMTADELQSTIIKRSVDYMDKLKQ